LVCNGPLIFRLPTISADVIKRAPEFCHTSIDQSFELRLAGFRSSFVIEYAPLSIGSIRPPGAV